MHTFKSVVAALGAEAQVTGGSIVVYRNGKHTEVGKVLPETGVFVMTPAGHALLEESAAPTAEVEEAPAEAPAKPARKAKKPASDLDDLELGE